MTKKPKARSTRSSPGRSANNRRPSLAVKRLATSEHVTPGDGNVFADLGFSPTEAKNLLVRAQLMSELTTVITGMTQAAAAATLGVSQPRISNLRRGKIGLFTIDALVNMLVRAGADVHVHVSRSAA